MLFLNGCPSCFSTFFSDNKMATVTKGRTRQMNGLIPGMTSGRSIGLFWSCGSGLWFSLVWKNNSHTNEPITLRQGDYITENGAHRFFSPAQHEVKAWTLDSTLGSERVIVFEVHVSAVMKTLVAGFKFCSIISLIYPYCYVHIHSLNGHNQTTETTDLKTSHSWSWDGQSVLKQPCWAPTGLLGYY